MSPAAIPPIFHWIWLGPSPIPEEHMAWMESWTSHHPRWTARLWRDSDLVVLRNRIEFEQSPNWAQKSDVARYEILLAHGGIYLDTDMECLRSLEPLLEGVNAFAGFEEAAIVGSAILGAHRGHPWMESVVTALPDSVATQWLQARKTGPGFLTRITDGRTDVKIFPPEVFYPYPAWGPRPSSPPPEAYAVHHFANSWGQQELRRIQEMLQAEIATVVPAGRRMVLLGGWSGLELGDQWLTRPFLERDGVDWGVPADDAEARVALEDHRRRGIDVIVFLDSARWWLEFYPGLAADLQAGAVSVYESPFLVAFWFTAADS